MPLSNKRLLSNRRPAPLMTIYSKTIGISKKRKIIQFSQFLAWLIRVSAFYPVQCQVQSRGRLTMSTQWSLAWENSRHLTTLPLVSPPNDVWDPSAEIPYWWRSLLRHQYGISALVSQTSFGGDDSAPKCRLFSQAKWSRAMVRFEERYRSREVPNVLIDGLDIPLFS